jgi:hypothetical protein
MKDKLKNTLEDEVELLGRSISILAIVGLLVVGGASAALLDSFGEVTGDADVNASVVIGDQEASSVSGPTVDAEFSQDEVVAGEFISTSHSLENRADEAVEVEINSGNQESGVSTSNVLYFLTDPDDVDSPSYDVEVSTSGPLTDESNHSVHVEGSETKDYATLLYPVDGLGDSDEITYRVETFGDHDVGNQGVDEIYLNTEDAQYAIVSGADVSNGQVTVDLDEVSYFRSAKPSEYSDVQSIGLGFGDASASYEEGVNANVNVTIDNVEAGGSNIDEVTQRETILSPTGRITEEFELDGDTFDVDTTTRYGLISTTHFSPYVVPDTYTVSTSVDPIE